MSTTGKKTRNWTFIVYPESAPENWKSILQDTGCEIALSPLHDQDVDEATGEYKKPHYHVMILFPGPTTYNVVNTICQSVNAPIPKDIKNTKGIYRYFTHKDNPDKFQYDEKDITFINGFNPLDIMQLTKSEVDEIKMRLQRLIRDNLIQEYSDLMDYLQDNELTPEYSVACSQTLFLNTYITSRRNKTLKEKHKKKSSDGGTSKD